MTHRILQAKTPEHALAMVRQFREQQSGNDPNKVRLRAHLSNYASYGLIAERTALELLGKGIDVELSPIGADHENNKHGSKLHPEVYRRILPHYLDDDQFTLLIHPPDYRHYFDYTTSFSNFAWLTMWEATRMHPSWVEALNSTKAILLPSTYCMDTFSANGVETPMFRISLGVDDVPLPLPQSGPFRFGCGGRLSHGGVRKGVEAVIAAFLKAFPDDKDVELTVKLFNDCVFEHVEDPRIKFIRQYLQPEEMRTWYGSLNCFVSMAQSEGFGLMPLSALRTRRPVISPVYSGTLDYLNDSNCYPVRWSYQKSGGHYKNAGHWVVPSVDDCAEKMRMVKEDYNEALFKAAVGEQATRKYNWGTTIKDILDVFRIIN